MGSFTNAGTKGNLSVKLWRGERTALIGMDVDQVEPDLVGFAIEVKGPDDKDYAPLRNRLNFAYPKTVKASVDGYKNFPSTEAPFQKFRWVHFPSDGKEGTYSYRVTKMMMPKDTPDNEVQADTSITLDIDLDRVVYNNFLDVGFTRNFASSQAYVERYKNNKAVIPGGGQDPLKFKKVAGDVYQWLGFEAYELIFGFLDEIVADKTLSLDIFAYDLNEPDIVSRLQKLGNRVRAVIDNSGEHKPDDSPESEVARLLSKSAGAANVTRMHFNGLQHNKVLIAKKNGQPVKVLFGSTNFSFRGIYIQANNALVLYSPEAAGMFAQIFESAFTAPTKFKSNTLSQKWHLLSGTSHPPVHFCFSPHTDSDLSLNPLAAAIDQATSSVFFDIAFFNQMKSGPTFNAINRLMDKDVFSYGISNNAKGLNVKKPDGSIGFVDFAYLAKNTPQPFAQEWSGMAASVKKSGKKSAPGINQHDKFVVTDFSLPTAKVFTGSSNLSVSGEEKNGDNLVMIEDPKVATSYAIEAVRIFDHLQFRSRMRADIAEKTDKESQKVMVLKKPTAISGQPAWFANYYKDGSQAEKDRLLFSH